MTHTTTEQSPSMRARTALMLCGSIAIFSLTTQSCANKSSASPQKSESTQTTAQLPQRGETIAVRTAEIQHTTITDNISVSGLLTTSNEGRLGFKIGGVIGRIMVKEGEFFRKGQTLATLNTAEIDAQTEQAMLGLEKAKRDFARASNLFRDSVATLEQMQNAKTGVDVAQKSLDVASFNRRYAAIVAGSNGFVIKKLANEGEVLAPGMPVLAIGETGTKSDWVVKAGLSDAEWSGVRLNQRASVQFDAFPGQMFDAVVSRKARAADLASGSFQVELTVKFRAQNQLALGMFAKATIFADAPRSAITIPYDALIEANGNQAFVFVRNGNHVIKKPITIQSFNQSTVIVQSGLDSVREIVVSNSAFLDEQSTISVAK
jgi:RND family efflux transporter MFP subunit